jgi:hypothetical protein
MLQIYLLRIRREQALTKVLLIGFNLIQGIAKTLKLLLHIEVAVLTVDFLQSQALFDRHHAHESLNYYSTKIT